LLGVDLSSKKHRIFASELFGVVFEFVFDLCVVLFVVTCMVDQHRRIGVLFGSCVWTCFLKQFRIACKHGVPHPTENQKTKTPRKMQTPARAQVWSQGARQSASATIPGRQHWAVKLKLPQRPAPTPCFAQAKIDRPQAGTSGSPS